MEDIEKLNAILNKIDDTNTGIKEGYERKKRSRSESLNFWSKLFDPNTGCYYYYNMHTGITQWQVPEGFVDNSSATIDYSTTIGPVSDNSYATSATFRQSGGSFSGTGDYWEKMGRPSDKAGRQMAAFFDINQLEENRKQAKLMKEERKHMNVDWKKVKEEKKKKKNKITNAWLFER